MASHGKIAVAGSMVAQAAVEGWSLQELAARAGVSRYVADQRCREAGVVLRVAYRARGGNRTGRKRVIQKTVGVPVQSRRWFEGRLNETVADSLAEIEAAELARRRELLDGARMGNGAAVAALQQFYRCRLIVPPAGTGDGGAYAHPGR